MSRIPLLHPGSNPNSGPGPRLDAGPGQSSTPRSRLRPSPGAAVAWGTLAACTVLALTMIALYGRNVPLAEDWLMVGPLTGREPELLKWLWAANNEHRVPLPRLIYLATLKLAGGDFRSGMVLNVLLLSTLSAAFILVAAAVAGRVRASFAFFPFALLHLGHWANLVWGWQIQFVSAVVLTCVPLLIIVRFGGAPSTRAVLVASVSLALLPLTGANGLIHAVSLLPWYVLAALHIRTSSRLSGTSDARPLLLAGSVVVAAALSAVYLLQYERPPWIPQNPGLLPSVKTAVAFVRMSVGPAVLEHRYIVAGTLAFLLAAAAALWTVAAQRAWRAQTREELLRITGLLCFAGGCAVLAAAIGHGRAGYVPDVGMPDRYALLAAPIVLTAFLTFELYGSRLVRSAGTWGLLALLLFCMPGSVRIATVWRDWYTPAADLVIEDAAAGISPSELAQRHRDFLMHWDEPGLAARIGLLRDAGIGVFGRVGAD